MHDHRRPLPLLFRTPWLAALVLVAAGLGSWIVAGTVAEGRPRHHPVLGDGRWLGGFGDLRRDAPRWMPALFDLELRGGRVQGRFVGRLKADVKGKLTDEGVRFSTRLRGRELDCQAQRQEAFLVGDCTFDGRPVQLRLTRTRTSDPRQTASYLGLYEVSPGHRIAITRDEVLLAVDLANGWSRALFWEHGDHFFTGTRMAVPFPVERRITFTRDRSGTVTGLEWVSDEGTVRATRCCAGRTEPFRFERAGTTFRGTLHLPAGEGPFPAAVWVHGSGRSTRDQAMQFPGFLVSEGFALLVYDKRGVGDSGGSYAMPDGSTFGIPFLERRAEDVREAARALGAHPNIDARRVGLFGVSQAGWVAPQAARSDDIAFTVILSGGATRLSLEDKHSRWSGETFATGGSVEDVIARLRASPGRDPDFRAHFAAQRSPGLWLYGFKDRSNPSQLCAELIEDVARTHDLDFTVVTYENANHALLEARRGGYDEYGALEGFVPDMHRVIADWLHEHAGAQADDARTGGIDPSSAPGPT